ncbi:hypothetical protein TraAM80_07650 [Trypanosoma rangeli]|uniref:Uncharacterized protein n=1 Tax=Trypanosoma rangeli TaxID=5698 RepID=A0A3R7RDF2_TRYRA|nr:uncharacterized protein TraAM80_07650 [Trypanosoma rangeli]RNF00357.1 hypothetical protein TraAM80_07650 [Trypanosoma rangeli]|eukprot:RNF00357.1 hypothetical protein TraAM80_07650 [Trypanosoma rangeli]
MENKRVLNQEEIDSALARQLHEEINGAETPNPALGSNSNQTSGAKLIACPACTFVNTFSDIVPGHTYTCEQCFTDIPVSTPNENRNASDDKQKTIMCTVCRCLNRIPQGNYDAIVCGTCCHELKSKKAESEVNPSQTTPAPTRPLQVRCGECSSINALRVGRDVSTLRFECGSCQTVNEVSL